MNIEEIEIDNPLYEKALDLRYRLFFEEFKLPKSVTADELESFSTHIVIMESEQLLASRPEVFGQATLAAVSSGEPRRSRAFR